MALALLVIAGAGLSQCWCSDTLKTMIDRDKICVRDILITFETKYFYFCLTERSSFCSAAPPSSCWSDAVHPFYLRLWLICTGFHIETSRKLSLGHKHVAFLLFVPNMICFRPVLSFSHHGHAQVRAMSLDMIFDLMLHC